MPDIMYEGELHTQGATLPKNVKINICLQRKTICRSKAPLSLINENCSKNLDKKNHYFWLKFKALQAVKRRKVFTVYGQGSNVVRRALIRRGWIEKMPPDRKCYFQPRKKIAQSILSKFVEEYNANFIWGKKRTKKKGPKKIVQQNTTSNIYKKQKTHGRPIRNRLKVLSHWSSKHGIFSTLKNSFWYYIDNVAEIIVPRTFSNANNYEKGEFINDYQLTACTSLLRFVIESLQSNKPIFHETGTISIDVIVFAINWCKEFFYMKEHKDIDSEIPKVITDEQWNSFLKNYRSLIAGKELFQIDRKCNMLNLINCAKYLVDKILKYRPQLNCEGCYNIWIIKPSGCSRGRGIEMSSKLDRIMDIITKTKKKYVVQKYIEKPLLIYNTKFDIRQYYLITRTYPLVIWMYTDCYLKFSSKNYSLKNFHRAIHLTNHSVQKHFKNCSQRHPGLPKNNMWNLYRYKCYLNKIGKQNVWETVVYPSMKKVIIGIMLSSQDSLVTSKSRFGLFGCDFILDNNFTPWLIEINNHPDLGATTDVTASICPQVITDIIKVVIDHAKNPKASTGKFECIYHQTITRIRHYKANTLEVIGSALPPNYSYKEENGSEEISSNCSETTGQSLLNILYNLNFTCQDDNGMDKGNKEGKATRIYSTKIGSDTTTELNNIKHLDVNSFPDICLTQKDSETLPEFNDVDSLDTNSNLMAKINLDTITKPDYCDYLGTNLDVEINSCIAKMTKSDYNDSLDAKSDANTNNYRAKIQLNALTKTDKSDCLFAKSDMETCSFMAKIESVALTKPDYSVCSNARLDVETIGYVAEIGKDALTKQDYGDCLDDKSDLETNNYIAKLEPDTLKESDYDDCLDSYSDVETSSYKIKFDVITKLNKGHCLYAKSDVEISNYVTRMELDSLSESNCGIVWMLFQMWKQAAKWFKWN